MANRLNELTQALEQRKREFLSVYRPSPQQEEVHRSPCTELIIRGGKRSGKSVAAAAVFGSRVTGTPIIGIDGNPIDSRWPVASHKHPRIYWIIGWETDHIGQTIHRLLFEPGMGGQFRCIRDEVTGQWRTYNRADPKDQDRYKESQLTDPVIPERMIVKDSWAWEDKRQNIFSQVELTNGARICAYPSSALHPKQGDAISGIWIDEDIRYPKHLKEWQDRLTDEEGWFIWSVWPHNQNDALVKLLDRADAAVEEDEPQIRSFRLAMTENPFITEKGKRESLGRMDSADEIARRNYGDLMTDTYAMYSIHVDSHFIQSKDTKTDKFTPTFAKIYDLWKASGKFPRTWTRYLAIDPSNTRTAVLSFVIPPQEDSRVYYGSMAIVEWELVVKKFSARMLAEELARKCSGETYEAFIMDQMAGRMTTIGRDDTTFQAYEKEFKKVKLYARSSGHGFIPGCNVPSQRYRIVRDMLSIQPDSQCPMLILVESQCPETRKEFTTYRKKVMEQADGEVILDQPSNPRTHDCMAALEYGCAYLYPLMMQGAAYIDPSLNRANGSGIYQKAMGLLKKLSAGDSEFVHLGPGAFDDATR
jgi:hypothetical protein